MNVKAKKASTKCRCFFIKRKSTKVWRPTSVARWAIFPSAARQMKRGKIGAAVKIDSYKGAVGDFGHRKPARSDKSKVVGSNPAPATKKSE